MAKPGGPVCNMRCDYCYYLSKESLFPEGVQRVTPEILEKYVRERIESAPGPNVHFEWHGGEPTFPGLNFYREAVRLERKYLPSGRTVTNGLQTNGLLIDEIWAKFLATEKFSVGLSLDGPEAFHDRFRKTAAGGVTHARVVKAYRLLKKHRVFCNLLCVLHAENVKDPDKTYGFFRELGATYLQFLPLVIPSGDRREFTAAAPAEIGDFLCRVFDRWISQDAGRIVVQNFDEALRPVYGEEHSLCVHRETCGNVAVLEHDGSFYACDHFVDPAHRLGSLTERSLADLASDPALKAFGDAKRDRLPEFCRKCDVLEACNGGCPKDRLDFTPDGEPGLNRLCSAYRSFFRHSRPELVRLAAHMKAGLPLRTFQAANPAA